MVEPGDDLLVSDRSPLEQIAAGFAELFAGLRRAFADPIIMSVFLAMVLTAAGFGAFWLSWKGSAASLSAPIQMAYLFSGGVSGFALVGAGMGIMYIQMSRHLEAREDRAWSLALEDALGLLARARRPRGLRPLARKHDVAGQRRTKVKRQRKQ